jgi:hypothetical protein
VKIQTRTAKKPYLHNKRVYNYEREHVTIIRKYHSATAPFLQQELEKKVWVENGSLIIKLTLNKTHKRTLKLVIWDCNGKAKLKQ